DSITFNTFGKLRDVDGIIDRMVQKINATIIDIVSHPTFGILSISLLLLIFFLDLECAFINNILILFYCILSIVNVSFVYKIKKYDFFYNSVIYKIYTILFLILKYYFFFYSNNEIVYKKKTIKNF